MYSLRRTLVLGTTLGTAAVVVVAGVLLYVLVRLSLLKQFDGSLLDKARLLASTIEQEEEKLELEFTELDMGEFQGASPSAYLHLWLADGSTVYQSYPFTQDRLQPAAESSAMPAVWRTILPDGRNGRSAMLSFTAPRRETDLDAADGGDETGSMDATSNVTLVLARSTASIDQVLLQLASFLLLIGVAAVVCCGAVLSVMVRRGLWPLRRLAGEIADLGEERLSQPIALDRAPAELQPVIARLNDLLGRLDAAFERERSFSTNVAHELRNPLAGLRLKLDLAAARLREPDEYQQTVADCREITGQMQRMVENLLSLARLDAGQVETRYARIAVAELLRECWGPYEDAASDRGLKVLWSLSQDLSVVSDPSLMRLVMSNVMENAVNYANDGGEVRLAAMPTEHGVQISVVNTGSALSQAEAERAFDRLWRHDAARSAAGLHCGLGLSLVQKIVGALEGSVTVCSESGGDFEVSISIADRDPRGSEETGANEASEDRQGSTGQDVPIRDDS